MLKRHWKICDGTNNSPDLRERFLEGVGTITDTKLRKEAALPNIKGTIKNGEGKFEPVGEFNWILPDGPWLEVKWTQGFSSGGGSRSSGTGISEIRFDAHAANPIYSDNATTVQPKSYTVIYLIKTR